MQQIFVVALEEKIEEQKDALRSQRMELDYQKLFIKNLQSRISEPNAEKEKLLNNIDALENKLHVSQEKLKAQIIDFNKLEKGLKHNLKK